MQADRRYELVGPLLPSLDDLSHDLRTALESKWLSNHGPYVRRLEDRLREALGAEHAIAVSSCTLGLVVTLAALDLHGEVLVPSFAFPAAAHAIHWAGCKPVFLDVDPKTWTLSPESARRMRGPRTVAVLALNMFGIPPDLDALVASVPDLPVICDEAHGFLAHRVSRARPAARVYSLHATKTVVAGEGGVVCTDDEDLAARIRSLINFGFTDGYDCEKIGLNAKMPELSAILALHHLERVETTIEANRSWIARYRAAIAEVPGIEVQEVPPETTASAQYAAIRIDAETFGISRDEVQARLLEQGIVSKPYFDPPLHELTCYAGKCRQDACPVSERLGRTVLCLPLHPADPPETASRIADRILAMRAR